VLNYLFSIKVPPVPNFFLIVHKTTSYTIHINICGTDMPFLGESMLQHMFSVGLPDINVKGHGNWEWTSHQIVTERDNEYLEGSLNTQSDYKWCEQLQSFISKEATATQKLKALDSKEQFKRSLLHCTCTQVQHKFCLLPCTFRTIFILVPDILQ